MGRPGSGRGRQDTPAGVGFVGFLRARQFPLAQSQVDAQILFRSLLMELAREAVSGQQNARLCLLHVVRGRASFTGHQKLSETLKSVDV